MKKIIAVAAAVVVALAATGSVVAVLAKKPELI